MSADEIRLSEDVFVDSLLSGAETSGVPLLSANYARAYIDVNRGPYELDEAMFDDEIPAYAVRSARVVAGLGSIARVVAEGREIYSGKLSFSEVKSRIDLLHHPYHQTLQGLINGALAGFGAAVLVDWHSMPSGPFGHPAVPGPDVVLGDRFGKSCDPGVTERLQAAFERRGYKVVRNAPFAGGFTTEAYGRTADSVHAIQVELNRRLYVNETTLEPTAGFHDLQRDLDGITAELAALNWDFLIQTDSSRTKGHLD